MEKLVRVRVRVTVRVRVRVRVTVRGGVGVVAPRRYFFAGSKSSVALGDIGEIWARYGRDVGEI